MKKKIIGGIAVMAMAAITAFNVNFNTQSNNLSDIFLENVEALANGEGSTHECSSGSSECVRVIEGNTVHLFYKS